jgi:non-reducing end alpha-L-arabinofuranosidase
MVASGTHVNSGCCFDYGNAETNNDDNGNGHMDAVYFGTLCWFAPCTGSGPWVQADLENGLFSGGSGNNPNNKGNSSTFVTALVKNNGTTTYALKGGNADSGSLTTWYSGALPTTSGYAPMRQEGAIILGTGGDNSIRHFNFIAYIASDGGSNAWDAASLWQDDTTWAAAAPWA